MSEVNLLKSLPRPKRDVSARATAKSKNIIRIARQYSGAYFDGPREFGYGGYTYDGRWQPVARDIVKFYGLKTNDRVLDVGCAKGFLVKDLLEWGIDAFGLDISLYAIQECEPEVVGRLHLGDAIALPFPDDSFACVLSLNTLHNLEREEIIVALGEIERVARGRSFVQVDSYRTPQEKAAFEAWVLTARFHDTPEGWVRVFKEAGYSGDYDWTIIDGA